MTLIELTAVGEILLALDRTVLSFLKLSSLMGEITGSLVSKNTSQVDE